jgi:hypothetical protein
MAVEFGVSSVHMRNASSNKVAIAADEAHQHAGASRAAGAVGGKEALAVLRHVAGTVANHLPVAGFRGLFRTSSCSVSAAARLVVEPCLCCRRLIAAA